MTIAADLGNTCIFPSLTSGGCLHVISHEISVDGRQFADYLAASERLWHFVDAWRSR